MYRLAELIREEVTEQPFELAYIDAFLGLPRVIRRFQRVEISLLVLRKLLGDRAFPRQKQAEPDAQHQVGSRPCGAAVAIIKRMNPADAPQHVCSQMNGRRGRVVVHVVAQFFNKESNFDR